MPDMTSMTGGTAVPFSGGGSGVCRCGALVPPREGGWGCTECGGDCCPACAFWLESTVYCQDCADRLLAA
ncbi:MAG: hypothetical protein ACREMB_03020 [Candidatus Rokuibacteriota bacterium]